MNFNVLNVCSLELHDFITTETIQDQNSTYSIHLTKIYS